MEALILLEALTPAQSAVDRAPDDMAARINLVRLFYLLGRSTDAEEALAKVETRAKVREALFLVDAQLKSNPGDVALQRIRQVLTGSTTRPANP
jgi:Flp pilus assembly protein TadD